MDNTDDNYISLFNQSTILTADNDTIKSNINNQLYVNSVNTNLIKFNNSLKLLGSTINNSTVETNLTNDYIVNNSINQEKIYGLTTDLINILNKFNDYVLTTFLTSNYKNNTQLTTLLNDYVLTSYLISNYYTKTQSDNLYYNKTYIDNLIALYYTKVQSDNLYYNKTTSDGKYALITSLANYYDKSTSDGKYALITSLTTTNSNVSTLQGYFTSNKLNLSNLTSGGNNYGVLLNNNVSVLSYGLITDNYINTISQSKIINLSTDLTTINNKFNNYVLTTYLNANYYDIATSNNTYALISSLNTTNSNVSVLQGYFTSNRLKLSNLANNTTTTKQLLFSQNGTNYYAVINNIDDQSIFGSKIVNNTIGQNQIDSFFYNNALYAYNNWRDSFTGAISLAALNTPGSNGTYYLKANKTALLTQISWDNTSNLTPTFNLPYQIVSSQSGYGSGDTCAFQIIQQGNRTTSTGAGFTVSHADNVGLYTAQFGFNSSGRFPTTTPNYIQYQSPYTYIYSTQDIFMFCKSTTNNNISARIQLMSNPDKVFISSNTNLTNWDLERVRNIYVSNIYANTDNSTWTRVNNNLECSATFKCDTLQAYSATNIISFVNNTSFSNLSLNNINNIYCSNLYANTTNNTEIIFNNIINHNNNLLKNYNLDNQTFIKSASGNICQKLNANNLYGAWSICGSDNAGPSFGMNITTGGFKSSYISTPYDFSLGSSTKNFMYMTTGATQATFDFSNSILKIDNLVSSSGNPTNIGALNCIGTLNMNGNTIINCPSLGGTITGSNSISVNTGGYNFLTQTNTTKSSVIIYGMSSTSFFHENQNGESAGCGADGASDNFTIWTAGDGGSLLNIADEDNANTRVAYVNTSGILVAVSSRERKHSIKSKNNNDVLNRFLKLNVKSYAYKYEFKEDDTEKKKQRMINKSKKQQLGLILEEVYEILPNCCSFYDNELDDKLIDDDNIKDKNITFKNKPKLEDVDDISNKGINYTNILLYFIMAFQEYVKKNDNSTITKNSLYINDKLDEIKARLDNIEYNNLSPENVYRIKNIINTQDEIYKCINNDINNCKLDNQLLRDKYIDTVESNTIINKNLNEKIINLENEIKELKDENAKFKIALKMIMDKLNKKV